MNQTTDSLTEFRATNPDDIGSLRVLKGTAKYKDLKRILPGAIFLVNGSQMTLQGSTSSLNGKYLYYMFVGYSERVRSTKCVFVSQGGGWQFVERTVRRIFQPRWLP